MINKVKTLGAFCGNAALFISFVVANPAVADGVVHRISAGTPDQCVALGYWPGCDANWSLVALQFDDGTVTGQFTDRWAGAQGVQGEVTCLVVDGNEAWVSGTAWYFVRGKVFEFPFFVKVVDNGNSANDPSDEISYTHGTPSPSFNCEYIHEHPSPVFEQTWAVQQGQVTID
jgi:hypothetical protein